MIFTCIGHAKFLIELENGLRIVTDPYDATCGYPVTPIPADVVLVSHGHHDHSAVDTIPGEPRVIDAAGQKRGKTLLFAIRAEGLNAIHLGDLGHIPTAAQIEALGPADVLMIPVGGFFTIDAAQAKETAGLLGTRVILPMHYKTRVNADWPIAPVEAFIQLYDCPAEEVNLLRVAKGDMMCQPKIAVLLPQSLKE